MSKLFLDEKGILRVAKEVEQITVEEAHKLYDHLKSEIAVLEGYFSKDAGTPTDATQVTPGAPAQASTETAPAQTEQTTAPTEQTPTPPVEQPQTQPADPNQQVPAPEVQPATPAADPNQTPVQTAQPDPNAIPPLQ